MLVLCALSKRAPIDELRYNPFMFPIHMRTTLSIDMFVAVVLFALYGACECVCVPWLLRALEHFTFFSHSPCNAIASMASECQHRLYIYFPSSSSSSSISILAFYYLCSDCEKQRLCCLHLMCRVIARARASHTQKMNQFLFVYFLFSFDPRFTSIFRRWFELSELHVSPFSVAIALYHSISNWMVFAFSIGIPRNGETFDVFSPNTEYCVNALPI